MSGPKFALLALILIVAVFVVSIYLGISHRSGQENSDQVTAELKQSKHPVIAKLGAAFPPRSPTLNIAGGCLHLSNEVLTFNRGLCMLVASPAKRRMLVIPPPDHRIVKFEVSSGSVSFAPDGLNKIERGSSPQVWQPRDEGSLIIGKENEDRLTLVCVSLGACQVQFE